MGKHTGAKHPARRGICIAVILAAALLILCQTVTAVLYGQNFFLRFQSQDAPELKDFPKLQGQPEEFTSNRGQLLHGDFIWAAGESKPAKALIVLSHGYGGGGYRGYLPQIEYLAERGYLVFAFDKTGTDLSEGENVRGLPQGVIDGIAAVEFAQEQELAAGLPLFLYGHSWGGYSTCASLEYLPQVKAAVSLSGFNRSQDMLMDFGTNMYGGFVRLMGPFLTACDLALFGGHAFDSSEKGLAATQAEVLLFHSADDPVINIEYSFDLYQTNLGSRENLHFVRLEDRGHNVFGDEHEPDAAVLQQIVDFYDGVLQKLR